MKLIYVTNARIPTEKAHGYQICKMCEEFGNAGMEVELWVPTRENNIQDDPFLFYGLKRNFKVKTIGSFDFLRYNKFHKPAFFLQSMAYSVKILFKHADKRAVFYTRNPEIAFILGIKGAKVVYEAHGWPKSKNFLYKVFLKNIKNIIAINHFIKQAHIKNGFENDKILVSPDGVDLEKFDLHISRDEAREKLNLPREKRIVLYSGHLYKWKGVDILIESAKFLNDNFLIFIIGGTGKDILRCKQIAKNYENVSLTGYKSFLEIPYWLKAADFLILPNINEEEISKYYTSPLKLFEYMASKRPIIASSLPSIMEILDSNNSFLIEPLNPEKLAAAIKFLSQNQELADKLRQKAFLDVKKYTWEKRAEEILRFINK